MNVMDRVNFINSVASGEVVICPSCGAQNKSGDTFCLTCGERLASKKQNSGSASSSQTADKSQETGSLPASGEVAFKQVEDIPQKQGSKIPLAQVAEIPQEPEPIAVFAQGLPEWNIEPPQVFVKRRK